MTAVKNITNGQIELAFDPEDKVGENYKFIRIPGGDVYDGVRKRDPNAKTNYYIESKNNNKQILELDHSHKSLKNIKSSLGSHKKLNIQPTHFRLKCLCSEIQSKLNLVSLFHFFKAFLQEWLFYSPLLSICHLPCLNHQLESKIIQ